jgi:hypothetical protein
MRFVLAALLAFAQTPATPPPAGSISGVVRDAVSKEPVANVTVLTTIDATYINGVIHEQDGAHDVTSTTDAQGSYSLKDLPPSTYLVMVRGQQAQFSSSRVAVLSSGQDLTLNFAAEMPGTITGVVMDDNKEPIAGAEVHLATREYYLGTIRYFLKKTARTDDQGRYTLGGATPGLPYLVMAQKPLQRAAAISEDPSDPKLRRQAFAPTFYPNSMAVDGGAPLTLRSGERREGVDIRVQRTPSLCVEGTAQPAMTAQVAIVEDQPSIGLSSTGGLSGGYPQVSTGEDGKFRFCGLHAGVYRIMAMLGPRSRTEPPAQYGVTTVTLRDEDVRGVKAPLAPGITLKGEVVWDGPAPEQPLDASATFSINHLYRAQYSGEELSTQAAVPGEFTLHGVEMDEYAVRTRVNAAGVYIKDIVYGGNSVHYTPLRLGSAMGDAGVKVIVARDAGGVAFQVTADGKPVGDGRVYLFPADIRDEAELQARMSGGYIDQNGSYQTGLTLPPGKYYAIALTERLDPTPECMSKLWQARTRAKEVEITAGQTAQVSLEPASIQ